MRRYELVPEPVVVWRPVAVWRHSEDRANEAPEAFSRVESDNPEGLLRAVGELSPSELETTIVAIDEAVDADTVIALGAVLVDSGVVAIETRYAVAINRVFATHRAIEAGAL